MTVWHSKRVLVIGAGRQGLSLTRYLSHQGADVILTDLRTSDELEEQRNSLIDAHVTFAFGGHPLHLLDDCDLVCPSGGVPLSQPLVLEAQARGIPLSNDSQIFLEEVPCMVIGVTGSSGKTTTTTLLGRIARAALGSDRTWVGGNIGNPLISDLSQMRSDHLVIMELSSFQLEIMTKAPQIAGILNLAPNHLDRHISMENYTRAKARILEYQKAGDIGVLNQDDPVSWNLRNLLKGKLISFGRNKPDGQQSGVYVKNGSISFWDGESATQLLPTDKILLRGEHNIDNVLAAFAMAIAAGLPDEALVVGVDGFTGVEHRLEFVRHWGGASWYNDSIATAPERVIAAIKSFDEPIVLLAGGRDKDLSWNEFAKWVHRRVDHLILFGEAKDTILQAVKSVQNHECPFSIHSYDCLSEALKTAQEVVEPGDVLLFSPGGTSFDEFHDFSERGDFFKEWVNKLT